MQRTNIYLEDRQIEMLDRQASEQGISRAELIRRIIDQSLNGGDRDLEVDLAHLRAAFAGGPIDIEMPDRGSSARQRYLDELWNRG